MSGISTVIASRVLRVGRMHTLRLFQRLGCRPVAVRGHGSRQGHKWAARHLVAPLVVTGLLKSGCAGNDAESVGRAIATLPSDEALEASFADGRSFIMLVGRQPLPRLVSEAAIRETEREMGEAIKEFGLEISSLDVSELYRDLIAAVRQATTKSGERTGRDAAVE